MAKAVAAGSRLFKVVVQFLYLKDILEACDLIQAFLADLNASEFLVSFFEIFPAGVA